MRFVLNCTKDVSNYFEGRGWEDEDEEEEKKEKKEEKVGEEKEKEEKEEKEDQDKEMEEKDRNDEKKEEEGEKEGEKEEKKGNEIQIQKPTRFFYHRVGMYDSWFFFFPFFPPSPASNFIFI